MAKRPEKTINPGASTAAEAAQANGQGGAGEGGFRRALPEVDLRPDSVANRRLLEGAAVVASAPKATPAAKIKPKTAIKDSFTFPADYELIKEAQDRALDHRLKLSKSGAVRAGLRLLAALDNDAFVKAIGDIEDGVPGPKR